jgi:hypothetical protein
LALAKRSMWTMDGERIEPVDRTAEAAAEAA